MSTLDSVLSPAEDLPGVAAPTWLRRLGTGLERVGEWLNPLLVKECRQALKSRQFAISFSLVLLLCWGWSIVGVAAQGPQVSYRFEGSRMFFGYYAILAFPLLVIVPASAFRSLTAEREDNTFELIAITALRPRQIVGGKLGSAVAQSLVYMSAVAPCLAFTYLLRGIDMITICWILGCTFLASVGLALVSLFFATSAREKHWQSVMSVLMIIGLFQAFALALTICAGILRWPGMFNEEYFWPLNLAFLTAYASSFALIYLAAGAQLTFTADNRSTPLRIAMFVQQALFGGWMAYFCVSMARETDERATIPCLMFFTVIATFYWLGMGSFMLGESPELSPRVKRSLPSSLLGRMFLTWFNPGPGTGYLFALANLACVASIAWAGLWWWRHSAARVSLSVEECAICILLMLAYVTIYLGIANIILRGARRISPVSPVTGLLVVSLLLLAAWGVPWVIRQMTDYYGSGYSLLHLSDPFWSAAAVILPGSPPWIAAEVPLIIVPAAAIVLFINLLQLRRDLHHVRIAAPLRVEQEEAELAAATRPPLEQPGSPWD